MQRTQLSFPQKTRILILIKDFLSRNPVLFVAMAASLISAIFVPPDKTYLNYLDIKTLTCLFCVLAVVCALRNIDFFTVLAKKIVVTFHTARLAILGLVYITFLGSMLIANDMALITFLPLGYFVLSCTGKQKYMAFTFILQNIAANLGGMLTPFGNPQNLYLYSKFNIPTVEFIATMLPLFLFAVFLITICCLFIKSEPLSVAQESKTLPVRRTTVYLVLFFLAIAIVFKGIPFWIGLLVIPVALYFYDRKALSDVDYPLLLTFVCFFVFSGNIARIDAVREVFTTLLEKSTLLSSVISCQFISNVPTAILFSQFTENYHDLLVGVNIGGVGTLISSLASLITFKEYTKHNPGKSLKYIALFSAFNFGFLFLLTGFALLY